MIFPGTHRVAWAPHQQGAGLVELMIGVTLGLALALLAVILHQSGARALRASDAQAQLHEQGQLALEIIGREILQAGYTHGITLRQGRLRSGMALAVLGCEGRPFAAGFPGNVYPQAAWPLPCALAQAGSASDSLVVIREAGEPGGVLPSSRAEVFLANINGSEGSTCQGNHLPLVAFVVGAAPSWLPAIEPLKSVPAGADAVTAVALNHYYVDHRAAPGVIGGRLMCAGVGRGGLVESPQPVMQGVEQLRLSYGIDLDGDGAVDQHRSAAGISAVDTWSKVLTVHVCLVLRGELGGVALASHRYVDCNGVERRSSTGVMQRAFKASFFLRNRNAGQG